MSIYFDQMPVANQEPIGFPFPEIATALGPDAELTIYRLLRTAGKDMSPQHNYDRIGTGESRISKADLALDPVELAQKRAKHMADSIVGAIVDIADPNDRQSGRREFYFSFDNDVHRDAYQGIRAEFGLDETAEPEDGLVLDLGSAVVVSEVLRYEDRGVSPPSLSHSNAEHEGTIFGVNLKVLPKRNKQI